MKNIKKIEENLNELYRYHIVPGWRWNERTWNRFKETFRKIPMCKDSVGNVYLNSSSVDDVLKAIAEKNVLILQAHLDHPGAALIGKVFESDGKKLYSAAWYGNYHPLLEAKTVTVYDETSEETEDCLIEADVNRFGERLLYFWSDKEYKTPAYLHFNDDKAHFDVENNTVSGWALDDQINCTVLLEIFKGGLQKNVIGLLTLDEERGAFGIEYFKQLVDKRCGGAKPLLINLEAPSEKDETGLSLGKGMKIRLADSRGTFSNEICELLQKLLPGNKAMEIKTGGTEAGILSAKGWQTGSLAIPVRYSHNGSGEGVWYNEDVSISDVDDMHNAVETICNSASLFTSLIKEDGGRQLHKVEVHDEASETINAIRQTEEYGNFLLNIAGSWNKKQREYRIPTVNISSDEYKKYRGNILEGKLKPLDNKLLYSYAAEILPKVSKTVGVEKYDTLHIFLLLAGNFNAKHLNSGIGLSVEQLDFSDIKRILAHEMTHWCTSEILLANYPRTPARGIISEGLACFISGEVAGIPPQKTLNIEESAYKTYQEKEKDLKRRFRRLLETSCIEFKGNRHKILQCTDSFDPFTIHRNNPYNKYGYFLGYNFINFCREKDYSFERIINSPEKTFELLNIYLNG